RRGLLDRAVAVRGAGVLCAAGALHALARRGRPPPRRPGRTNPPSRRRSRRTRPYLIPDDRMLTRFLCLLLLVCAWLPAHARPQYEVDYLVRFLPGDGSAAVTISVAPDEGRITRLDFAMD